MVSANFINNLKNMIMENYRVTERVEIDNGRRRRRVSWGSIFAGTAVVLAVSMLLSVLGSSIGLFILNPTEPQPFSGVFGTVGIWTAVSILIGLACGGFVAGKLAGNDGFIHGFVVWSVTMIAGVLMVGSITAGAIRLAGNVIGTAGKVVANAGQVVDKGVAALTDEAQNIFGGIDFNEDMDEMKSDVRQALRRSGVKEFQPEYLRGQYRAISRDLQRTIKRVAANPQHAEPIIEDFTKRLEKRAERFANKINREDVVSLVANNSNLSRAQAEDTVDQYMELLEQGKEKIGQLQEAVQEAGQEWQVKKEELLVEANRAANKAGWTGVITFIALLLGAAVSSFAGFWGTRKTKEGYEA